MLKRSRFFCLFILLTVAEKTAPAAIWDVYCSLLQPEVPNVHGLVFFLKSLFGKSVHFDCVDLHRLGSGICIRTWQLWNSNAWVDSPLLPCVLNRNLKLFLAQCSLHCVGQLEKNSHIHREQRGLRVSPVMFWDSACFEAKLKSSTAFC